MRIAAALAAATILAAAPAALAEGETPVELRVGEAVNVCSAGLATCPLMTSICDDPKVVTVELGKAGAELKAVSPGTTLCGLVGSNGLRRVLKVTVKAKE